MPLAVSSRFASVIARWYPGRPCKTMLDTAMSKDISLKKLFISDLFPFPPPQQEIDDIG